MSKQSIRLYKFLETDKTNLKKTKSAIQASSSPDFDQKYLAPAVRSHLSNRAVQRLLAQRDGHAPTELDDTTATRINSARGGGQSLDTTIQQKMGDAMGSDFSRVRVHTGSESNQLNEQLGAKAFTTGSDVFFRDGEYSPGSSSGQALLAHELTHVVQQGSGAVGGNGGKMAVNAPGDQFEQEADAVAKQVMSAQAAAPAVQRQALPEEEIQAKRVQREAMAEEEEMAQMQELPEEEEMAAAQRQEMPEEEMIE